MALQKVYWLFTGAHFLPIDFYINMVTMIQSFFLKEQAP